MKLAKIFRQILEAGEEMGIPPDPSMGAPTASADPNAGMADPNQPPDMAEPEIEPEPENENFIVFEKDGIVASLFPAQKKITFAPQFHAAIAKNIESYITMLKNKFSNVNVISKGNRVLDVKFDPRQDFDAVIELLRELSGNA